MCFPSTIFSIDAKRTHFSYPQLNSEERTLLLSLPEDLEDLFDGNLGDWATEPVDLDLNPYFKPFNSRYYLVPKINKGGFQRELKHLL